MVLNALMVVVKPRAFLLLVSLWHCGQDVLSGLVLTPFLEENIEVVPRSGSVLAELESWWLLSILYSLLLLLNHGVMLERIHVDLSVLQRCNWYELHLKGLMSHRPRLESLLEHLNFGLDTLLIADCLIRSLYVLPQEG